MSSERTVAAKDVLAAVMELRRRGTGPALRQLEQEEPDLAEFVLEEVSAVHQSLARTGVTARQLRRLTDRVEALVLVTVAALRRGHVRLWRADAAGTPLAALDHRVDAEADEVDDADVRDRNHDHDHDHDHHDHDHHDHDDHDLADAGRAERRDEENEPTEQSDGGDDE